MAEFSFEIFISAPPNLVSAFFVPQRMPYWYGAEMQACFEVQGGAAEFCVGQKVRITGKLRNREVSLTAVITNFEFGRLLEWRFQDAYGVRGMQRWEISPSDGGTQVKMRDHYELSGRLGKFWDWLVMRHGVARRDRHWLKRLANLAEASGR
ncbi:MAG: SRPBCC family protein [Candidatus Acidiferrales bacterium]